jgi:hypothetical protein
VFRRQEDALNATGTEGHVPCAGCTGAEGKEAEANIMATTKLDRAAWQKTFDQLSRTQLVGKEVEIEATGLSIGDQVEQEWIQLLGMSYDPNNDLIEILVEGLDHLIPKPREVWVDHGPTGLASMEVIDADDVRQIIRLREPLMLPYSGTA